MEAVLNEKDDCLINFRVSKATKRIFDDVCKFNHTSRTTMLTNLMRQHINEMAPQINEYANNTKTISKVLKAKDQTENKPERWGDLIKDPITQTWVPSKDYK